MKKIIVAIFFLTVLRCICHAQADSLTKERRDSLLHGLDTARQDTSRVLLIAELANHYKFYLPDSALFYGYKALAWSRQIKFPEGEAAALRYIAITQLTLGNDSKALQTDLQGLKIAEKNDLVLYKAIFLSQLGFDYFWRVKNNTKALEYFKKSKALFDSLQDFNNSTIQQMMIGDTYLGLNQSDSALYYCESAYKNAVQLNVDWVTLPALLVLGKIQDNRGNPDLALAYSLQSVSKAAEPLAFFRCYFAIARLYEKMKKRDSCIYYANKALEVVSGGGFYTDIIDANVLLSRIYEKTGAQKALDYSKVALLYKDSISNLSRKVSVENLIVYDEQERQYEIETAKTAYRNRVKQYIWIGSLFVFLLIAFLLYRNNLRKQKAKLKIEKAYQELKATQAQLIQSEKMASLGELTAGIAHEIQNPLNFVNNFSEVNTELVDELEDEAEKGNIEEVKAIAKDIKENEQKIIHHGKRADAIVKGMLQHSRASTGKKEPTDINALADEYLRLSYHGMRAKDKTFNATPQTDFDTTIGKINIVPQDIGRVLLNLFNNAFYALAEKRKQVGTEYESIVSVSSKKVDNKVEIHVKDNGKGIPQKVVDKIFQPFFTTKPTGQGTGLGLSLSYDIIKAHGGEIKVETKEGEGAEFVILLPL